MTRYRAGQRKLSRRGTFVLLGMLMGALLVGGAVAGLPYVHKQSVDGAKTGAPATTASTAATLTKPPIHAGLGGSTDPSLRKLAEYEQVYGGAVADRAMVFESLPVSTDDASGHATDMATKLKEFAKFHIQPLVVMEPTNNGTPITLTDFAAGKYDSSLASYFNDLKAQGVTDAMMGLWVHFPEDNIPDWGNTDPALFETNVVKAAHIQKQVFPGSQVTILLNSQTFKSNDVNRDYGTFSSLLPYVHDLPKGLFSSFGLQGFPWVSAANQEKSQLLDPAQYLNANLAREAAAAMGVHEIWFNTGTFGRIYTNDPKQTVTFTPAQRQALLNGVLAQAKAAEYPGPHARGGFKVAINLFSMDSSNTGEATDWSYWHTGQTAAQAPAMATFKEFAEQTHTAGYSLWVFDSAQ